MATCTMKELVSGVKKTAKRNLGSYVTAKGVMGGTGGTNQNACSTPSELAHLGLPQAPTTKKGA